MMAAEGGSEFEVGTYLCPNTQSQVTLKQPRSLAFVRWPIIVEKCAACGKTHELQSTDVIHPPIYGRE